MLVYLLLIRCREMSYRWDSQNTNSLKAGLSTLCIGALETIILHCVRQVYGKVFTVKDKRAFRNKKL